MRARGSRRVLPALLCMALLLAADGPTTPSPTSDASEPSGQLTDVRTSCEVERGRDAQVVVCRVEGLPPGQVVRLTVETAPVGQPPRTTWTGASTAGPSGTTTVRTALPCAATGEAPVQVDADADGSYRHREEVTMAEGCRPTWMLTGGEVARLVAVVLVVVTAMLAAVARKRELAAARAAARTRRRRGHH